MIKSMTGFSSRERQHSLFGKVCVELRTSNHKFLDIVFHLPAGCLSLEGRIKKEIEARIKRGRVICAINIIGAQSQGVFINKGLLKNYISELKKIKRRFCIKDEININTIIHLPGILSLVANRTPAASLWLHLKILVNQALDDLVQARQKEGRALYVYFNGRAKTLKANLGLLKRRFKTVIKEKLGKINTDEERSAFLKNTDITEEIERLSFHISHFANRLSKLGPIGKELDFIAQEMQREANTISAKSCDVLVSANAVGIKSQIEKIREQLQNIE